MQPGQNKRVKMPERPAQERIKDFNEVALGLSEKDAISEAKRCIQCKNPKCVSNCPVEINIPAFIKLIAESDFKGANKKIRGKNSLPAVCGRVCPQEDQCEKTCILGIKGEPIAIGSLERFAAEYPPSETPVPIKLVGPKVAIIGSGPAGLTCAGDLALKGYQVKIFESLHTAGGVLKYGIPEFRLPKSIVDNEIEYVKSLGVELITDFLAGKTATIEELFKENFKAIFIGAGAGLPNSLGIPGENFQGVYSANEFLFRVNMMKAYKFPEYLTPVITGKKVVVFGAGNVAMDSARCALRLGADKVIIAYRRSRKEMPARAEEIIRAEEEGVEFLLLTAPVEIIPDDAGRVKQVELLKMELGEPDSSGRRRPKALPGSEFKLDCDLAICAIGNSPNPLIPKSTADLKIEKWGGVIVADNKETSIKGVFAGGDIVRGAATVISAMGDGKIAARSIDEMLSKK
ncbi:MAG: NADPH-dependent glutamate synthase [Candidatus Saganbacteria bacterium]|uniref:NADPH-dependent glutamate synthase n=1 Tax=Candidatus Saganbacteria bacterium TaxID=2575572 RepID=A0A833L2C1_UNCSA|nr:MAG: NADPH-dependent glutamate synthase [Candidatus Saganbacteria bacterium]